MKNLKAIREKTGISQKSLAEALGVDENTVWRWEADRVSPSVEMGRQIADFFNVSVDTLLNGPKSSELKIIIDWEVEEMSAITIGDPGVFIGYRENDDCLLFSGAIPADSNLEDVLSAIRVRLEAAMAGRGAYKAVRSAKKEQGR